MSKRGLKERKLSDSKNGHVSDNDPLSSQNTDKICLKRRLGLISGVSFIVGTVIGSGIFISPKGVLQNTGSVGLCMIIWFLCGVLALLTSLVYAELGTMFKKSGADYIYFLETFGPIPAFLFFWETSVIAIPGSTVIKAMTFAEYLTEIMFDGCGPPILIKKLLAALVILAVAITNCKSVNLAARFQIVFAVTKVAALSMISIGGIVMMAKGTVIALGTGFQDTTDSPSLVAYAVYNGMFAYGGWRNLNFIVEELKNPSVTLPRAILISMPLVTVIYLLVNISYFAVMTKEEFLSSWAVGVVWGEKVLGPAAFLIPIVVACSVYGSINGGIFVNGRMIFAASREKHLPEIFCCINARSYIPVPSIILTTVVSLILLIPSDIGTLINLMGFTSWIIYGAIMVVFLVLRYKRKDIHRPVKIPILIPIIVLLCAIYLVVAPMLKDPKIEFLYAGIFIVASIILYIPFVYFKLRIPGIDSITTFSQLFLEVVPLCHDVDDDIHK